MILNRFQTLRTSTLGNPVATSTLELKARKAAWRATACLLAVLLRPSAVIAQTPPVTPPPNRPATQPRVSGDLQDRLAPGMADYTNRVLFGDIWVGPELSPRDRSLMVVSVLIATGKPGQLSGHLGRALGNGVTPTEASGVLTHLAVYCGWPAAVVALDVYQQVYTSRNIDTAPLRNAVAPLAAPVSEAARTRNTVDQFGAIAPKFT